MAKSAAAQALADRVNTTIASALKLDADQLAELGEFALTLIKARTKAGIDSFGKPFAPYSEAYNLLKNELRVAGLPASERRMDSITAGDGRGEKPDLSRSGHMMSGLTQAVNVGAQQTTLCFYSPEEERKATYHHFGTTKTEAISARGRDDDESFRTRKNMPRRRFLAITQTKEKKALAEVALEIARENVKQAFEQMKK